MAVEQSGNGVDLHLRDGSDSFAGADFDFVSVIGGLHHTTLTGTLDFK